MVDLIDDSRAILQNYKQQQYESSSQNRPMILCISNKAFISSSPLFFIVLYIGVYIKA